MSVPSVASTSDIHVREPRYLSSQHGDMLYDELGSTKFSVGMSQHL